MWVRGLKLHALAEPSACARVAPRVGAWIETTLLPSPIQTNKSHPVWVRGLKRYSIVNSLVSSVAPRVGAWIETRTVADGDNHVKSHPVWVRGLKQESGRREAKSGRSHPVWVRGLKPCRLLGFNGCHLVAPRVGAWIETIISKGGFRSELSHPVWVRGLKLPLVTHDNSIYRSHPVWVRGLKL